MRKIIVVTILLLLAFLCALWSPWNSWNLNVAQLFGISPPEQVGGLQVTSLAGEMTIYADGTQVGTVSPDNSPFNVPALSRGEHQIRLKRTSDVVGAFIEFNRLLKFESGVDVVISFELGPATEFSAGHVIYATKGLDSSQDINLNLKANTDALVSIDGVDVGPTPISGYSLGTGEQHDLVISAEGYESQQFKLLPEAQDLRDKIKGYDLNVDVDLFLQPVQVD